MEWRSMEVMEQRGRGVMGTDTALQHSIARSL